MTSIYQEIPFITSPSLIYVKEIISNFALSQGCKNCISKNDYSCSNCNCKNCTNRECFNVGKSSCIVRIFLEAFWRANEKEALNSFPA